MLMTCRVSSTPGSAAIIMILALSLTGCAVGTAGPDEPATSPKPSPTTAGAIFSDCVGCPEMVVIPPGEFLMGATPAESGGQFLEVPKHRVSIRQAFALGKYEVTFAQWDTCVADRGCSHRPDDEHWGRDARPVMRVSWTDAQEYLRWLSRMNGTAYRLPSEAEWEYAARAGTTTERYWGYDPHEACQNANVADWTARDANLPGTQGPVSVTIHNCRDGYVWTAPVGRFAPNAFGLYDMIGNVWEWVTDCWNPSYEKAPTDGSPWTSGRCDARVTRGGSYLAYPGYARAAARVAAPTSMRESASVSGWLGRWLSLERMPGSCNSGASSIRCVAPGTRAYSSDRIDSMPSTTTRGGPSRRWSR